MEIWKDVEGYEGHYQVSNKGNVKSLKTGKILRTSLTGKGYSKINLYKNGIEQTINVHRLVAEAFIANPDNKPCIDHIDTDRTNNNVDNLRWVTYSENMDNPITKEKVGKYRRSESTIARLVELSKLASKLGAEASKKKVRCITTGIVFDSAVEAARYYNLKSKSAVANAANPNNPKKTAGKLSDGTRLKWEYIN